MTEEQVVAQEAEATQEATEPKSEATENTEGQVETPPAEGEDLGAKAAPEEKPEEKSPSQLRRERRKAEMARLRESEQKAKQERDEIQARLDRIEQAAKASQPPKESDFDDFSEYQAALSAHKSMALLDDRERQRLSEEAERRQKELDALEQRKQEEAKENWAAQVSEAKARYADFDQVALNPNVPISDTVTGIILQSDAGADIAYYLGSHIDEAARISQMSDPVAVAMEIGRIQASISAPQPKVATEAPDPITPVKPEGTVSKDPEAMSFEDYEKGRKAGTIK